MPVLSMYTHTLTVAILSISSGSKVIVPAGEEFPDALVVLAWLAVPNAQRGRLPGRPQPENL